ncbi:MAG: LTA synthase family protein, partial [Campylobacterota bacterium]|nr:LTA synthase family protein [Campylobacterota bacterium]
KSHFKSEKPKNLVIFLQESLGAQFVGVLGDKRGLTPEFDKLSKEGILFTDLYSNGTRSVRGIAGVVAGFLPVAGQGVVKRNRSQSEFFTVASLLKPYGYYSSFIYGGEKRFDNMASWFYGNGFDEIIDEKMFENPIFKGVWGASDEDLVNRANEEFEALYKKDKPFVSVMFSTTNHTPFEFPDGRIELMDGVKKHSVENAIKFADFAIGKFIRDAKKLSYYKDTIFVIVADHNVRVYGDDLIPLNMFHIPALIVGGGVEPLHVDKLTTQPDVVATALDLVGLDLEYPILGKSIFSNSKKEVSLIQFHDMFGLRVGNKIAIIQPNVEPLTFVYENGHLTGIEHDKKLEHDLVSFITVIHHLYSTKTHTLPKGK